MKKLKRSLKYISKKAIDFIKKIKNGEKVGLIYDSDCDGIASAALILFVLEEMDKKVEKTMPSVWGNVKELKGELKKLDKVVLVDVPIDLIEKHLLEEKKKMLIFDHHPGRDLNSKDVVLINPRLEDPKIYQPTSYIIYKMFSSLLEERKWVALLGTVGDFGVDDCRDLVKIKDKRNIWKSKFGVAAMLLTSSVSIFGPKKSLKFLVDSKNLEDFVRRKEITIASKKFKEEFDRCMKEFEKNLEIHGKVLVSKIKPRYRGICSALITNLSTKNSEKIIFIFEKGKEIKIHGRCGSKEVDIGKVFRKLGIGGGHEAAGAGRVSEREENKIKKKILEELKDFTV